jgi:hypothetical protein
MPSTEETKPSPDCGGNESISQVAEDLGLDETELHQAFRSWLANQDAVSLEMRAASYAVYRVDKLSWAFKVTSKSRCSWRARAMELGSPGHLYAIDQNGSGKKFALTEIKGKSPQNQ